MLFTSSEQKNDLNEILLSFDLVARHQLLWPMCMSVQYYRISEVELKMCVVVLKKFEVLIMWIKFYPIL